MFIVLLNFSVNENQASKHMDGHMSWIKRGFDDGVFLTAGSLQPSLGGSIDVQRPPWPLLRILRSRHLCIHAHRMAEGRTTQDAYMDIRLHGWRR